MPALPPRTSDTILRQKKRVSPDSAGVVMTPARAGSSWSRTTAWCCSTSSLCCRAGREGENMRGETRGGEGRGGGDSGRGGEKRA